MVRVRLVGLAVVVALMVALLLGATVSGCSGTDTQAMVVMSSTTESSLVTTTVAETPTTSAPTTTTAAPSTTTTLPPTTTTAEPTTTTARVPQGISWEDALDHAGEKVTIIGPVVSTKYASRSNGSPTFLNIGRGYPDPDRFQVVIWGDDRGRFSSAPEDMYAGKNIAVTGTVKNYKGTAEIIVSSPKQIEVY